MKHFTFFVEGANDKKFLEAIMTKIQKSGMKIYDYDIKKLGGVEHFAVIDTYIKIIDRDQNIIIILDADENKDTRINQVINCFKHNSYKIDNLNLTKKQILQTVSGYEVNLWLWIFPNNKSKGSYETILWESITENDINKLYKEYSQQHADKINDLRINKLDGISKLNTNQYHKLCLSVFLHSHHKNKRDDYNPYAVLARNEFYGEIIAPLKDYENFIKKIITIQK